MVDSGGEYRGFVRHAAHDVRQSIWCSVTLLQISVLLRKALLVQPDRRPIKTRLDRRRLVDQSPDVIVCVPPPHQIPNSLTP